MLSAHGLVNLDPAFETIPPWANHGGAKLVKPQPRRLVAAQPQDSLQSEGTRPRLLAGDRPYSFEPHSQWFVRLLEQRASRDRGFVTTAGTDHSQSGPPPSAVATTLGARKALRPAKRHQVCNARLLRGEALIKLHPIAGVVLHHH